MGVMNNGMGAIENLNDQYVVVKRRYDALQSLASNVSYKTNGQITTETLSRDLKLISDVFQKVNSDDYPMLRDVRPLGKQYLDCVNDVQVFRRNLLCPDQNAAVASSADKLKETQRQYELSKKAFQEYYSCSVDSLETLHNAILAAIKNAQSIEYEKTKKMIAKANEILGAQIKTKLRSTDPVSPVKELPWHMLVARAPVSVTNLELMRDMGIKHIYGNLTVNLQTQGNVIIATDVESLEDKQIDEFLLAYIFRFIESFPLGAVNVHIFDDNTKYLFKRLNNCFQDEKTGEMAKRTIRIHTSLNDLASIRDISCEDIFKKISLNTPDLYAIYNNDRSDPFNLIVLRDGMLDGNGYATPEVLDTIRSLTDPSETGHRCGIRFLILDNSLSYEKSLTARNKQFIDSIRANCELKLEYNNKVGFFYGDKSVDVLHIEDNVDAFVQERSMALVDAINKKEKTNISIEDISASEVVHELDNIMYIPVGKTGGEIIELPLSCKDAGGTVAGQCIGYMAIGQSGSGKSSFFHSLVLNGCMKYSPKDLQFWLLDFKNGGASSKYSDSGIPHIKIIAENNKIDDALCLFQMVLEEMDRRNRAFNRNFTDNILEYNRKAVEKGLEYFPRIIIAIDEVQEIFREDNANVLKNLISSISSRMRSAGMHFVMVAQNLSEGKSYMLKESFMSSATGRISFRVAQDVLRDSGFGDDFTQRRQEIAELKAGEAYISYGSGTIKKVKMAFVSTDEMSGKVFAEIRDKYKEYEYLKPRVIGSRARLSILSQRQGIQGNYEDVFDELHAVNGICDAVLGEDVYRMSPFHVQFSQHENSAVLLLGSDKQMSSSMCASIALSLMKQDIELHLFNGDRTKASDGHGLVPHPFMYICQSISPDNNRIHNHRLDQLKNVVKDMYAEYLKRQADAQKADDEDPQFPAIVLIVNDLFGIECFNNNDIIESNADTGTESSPGTGGFDFNYDIFTASSSSSEQSSEKFREGIQNIISNFVKNGYRYNIHVVLAIKGDPSIWRTGRSVTTVNNVLLFNNTEYTDQIENSYYLKEMLKNIFNDGDEETIAVWTNRKVFSKIRPVIYKLSDVKEKEALDSLISRQEKQ